MFDARRKMDTLEDEAERFAAILLNNLQTAEASSGKDYAHAVLVDVLRERPEYELRSMLDRAGTAAPSRSSKHYAACAELLRHSIDGLRNEAISGLGHDPGAATAAMSQALGIVLDETFHISAADLLFSRRT